MRLLKIFMTMPNKFFLGEDKDFFVGSVYAKYHFNDFSKPLVITFAQDGKGLLKQEDIDNGVSPWGFSYIKKLGYNVLSFAELPETRSYYRDQSFRDDVALLSKLLPTFSERIGYGGSMGGYGVTAYSNVLNIGRVLVFNPISTRRKSIATWDFDEKRSLDTFKFDWDGEYSDGADTLASGFIVYDPFYKPDKLHAIRFENLVKLKFPGVGHGVSEFLKQLGELDWLVKSFLNNSLNVEDFNQKIKKRRRLERYYAWMLSKENIYLTEKRKKVLEKYRDLYDLSPDRKSGLMKNLNQEIDVLRDAAIMLEEKDIELSLKLMLIAKKYRPNGVVINKKIVQYRDKLKC